VHCFIGVYDPILEANVVNLATVLLPIYLHALFHLDLIPIDTFDVIKVAKINQQGRK